MDPFNSPAKVLHPPDKKGVVFHLSNPAIVWKQDSTCVTEQRARDRGIEEKAGTERLLEVI